MYHVMIVEDDKKIASLIQSHVERYGYEAYIVEDYSNIKSEFIKHNPHIVLMDINLPFYDGFYWCRDIRTISKAPIIFISARSSDMDQVMAIENGGDDYITKPFSYDVLIAKIKSALRRVYGEYSENNNSEVYEVKGLYLNINQNTLEFNGIKIELSKKEFLLIHSLLKKPNTIISRDELLEILWDDVDFVDDNTLSVNITRVRKRLEELGIRNAIETKRGQGYSITINWDI
ncbi:response regulator transcription factor [Alkaliphilus sp. MSJ-5]|uniref:Response regulator transcription factor n=1 Tax=Alkaliphilus flagellatus TaxID=2841507 RepID=A0ABS6FX77_9FIRM|nr:response regulator transcription factor [Alkaliphilus flagellatus]MBU5674828.1 response regulator transcription factor [Alkaliphilus flagellatus]